jgi:hypothetical protein
MTTELIFKQDSQRKQDRTEVLEIIGCVVIMVIAGFVIGCGVATWADSLPPSPAERSGQIEGPK